MPFGRVCMAALAILCASAVVAAGPSGAIIAGKVSYTGIPAKPEAINMAKQPECIKMYGKPPTTEKVLTGSGDTLQNVVVYISAGASDSSSPPATPVVFDQQRCHYTTHVLVFRAGQELSISNSDPFSHNIHPLAKINREWNKLQLPGTPPFTYSYDSEEFIPVKCNIHPWMQAYLVVLKTSHFAVTGEDGHFALPDLPAGTYTLTAWHELYGTQSQEITIAEGQRLAVNFTFKTNR